MNYYIHIFIITSLIALFNYENIKNVILKKHKNNSYRKVYLSSEHNIFIKGRITKEKMNETIHKIGNNKNINLIINSEGGDLFAGYDLIIKMIEKKPLSTFKCYALNAKSTAFDIFQYCDKRFVIPNSILFQHNASIEFKGSFEEFENFYYEKFELYRNTVSKLNKIISNKIKLDYGEYQKKIMKNWSIKGGKKILENNLADEIVIISDLQWLGI